ncbi:MAG: methyltransferase domain-containing protein [Candidatus Woesearchaeota archaeon]|jgi:ubiquinone/menaquinone biosynthesis C-methylase UbiE
MENKEWDRYAKKYHDCVISPFQKSVENPIFNDIKRISGKKKLIIADIGCGIGDFLPFLSKNFKKVIAVDFSKEMLKCSEKKNTKLKNITYLQADTRQLSKLKLNVDVAISVNSIILPSLKDNQKSLKEIHKSINKNGIYIGIFPSMESLLYNFSLVYEREWKKYENEEKAMKKTKKIVEYHKYNVISCVFDDDGEKQRLFYEFELKEMLKVAGFRNIEFKKVFYPWRCDVSGFEDFPGRDRMWDWYVICRK